MAAKVFRCQRGGNSTSRNGTRSSIEVPERVVMAHLKTSQGCFLDSSDVCDGGETSHERESLGLPVWVDYLIHALVQAEDGEITAKTQYQHMIG